MASSISNIAIKLKLMPKISMLVVTNDDQGPEPIYRMISW